MNEQMLAFIQSLPPEKQAQLMAQFSQQPQDPRMGLPGQNTGMEATQQAGMPGAFQDFEGQSGVIGDQQAKAEALRGTATPEGLRTQNAGYVAANPLSHLSAGIQKGMGNYQAREALAEKKKLSDTKTKLQEDFAANQFKKLKSQEMANELRQNRRGSQVEYNPQTSA